MVLLNETLRHKACGYIRFCSKDLCHQSRSDCSCCCCALESIMARNCDDFDWTQNYHKALQNNEMIAGSAKLFTAGGTVSMAAVDGS